MAISLFTPSANDLSIKFLYTIFGPMNGVLAAETAGTTTMTILGTMFKTFNSVVLTIGAFIIVYVTVVGVMATAHEGQFMGKKWNNMWIPIRTVLGVASLVPTGSGYSGLQIIMMWIIVQGIGAADVLWDTALRFVQQSGSPFEKVVVMIEPKDENGVRPDSLATMQAMKGILKGLTCDATSRLEYDPPFDITQGVFTKNHNARYYCNVKSGGFCDTPLQFDNNKMREYSQQQLGPAGSCGKITWCNHTRACGTKGSEVQCKACEASIDALADVLVVYQKLAQEIANIDYQYRNFYGQSADDKNPTPPAWLSTYCSENGITCRASTEATTYLPDPGEAMPVEEGDSEGKPNPPGEVIRTVYWQGHFENLFSDTSPIIIATDLYSALMAAATKKIAEEMPQSMDGGQALDSTFKDASDKGWALAGAYYYTIAGAGEEALDNVMPIVGYVDPDPSFFEAENALSKASCGGNAPCRNNINIASTLIQLAQDPKGSTMGGGGDERAGGAGSAVLSDSVSAVNNVVSNMMSGEGATDPVADLIIAGSVMLWIVQLAFAIFILVFFLTGLGACLSVYVLGTGVDNPLCGSLSMVYMLLVPAVLAFFGFLVVTGGTLSIYVPLIPFVIFILGVIGWFTSTIEAMVAGPLVALGIISPSGHHELMGKAEPAIGLLFNIFLRPSLMIFGLVAAVLLAGTMLKLFNTGMGVVFTKIAPNSPVALVLFLLVYLALILTVLNKCFAAIHIIPEKAGRWIGMPGEQYGESEGVSATKGAVDKGTASASAGMTSGVKKAAEKKVKDGKDKKEAQLEAKKDEKEGE